jgi:hypothetical protein
MTLPALPLRNRIVPDGPESREKFKHGFLFLHLPPKLTGTLVTRQSGGARSRHIFQGRERVAYFFPKDTTPPV